jgi:hypothetical protein
MKVLCVLKIVCFGTSMVAFRDYFQMGKKTILASFDVVFHAMASDEELLNTYLSTMMNGLHIFTNKFTTLMEWHCHLTVVTLDGRIVRLHGQGSLRERKVNLPLSLKLHVSQWYATSISI